ncbi:response regulator [Flavobacterium soyangense]|uniref:Response regulator n=1 Tax=Flavobacterium soyangense TaxID=2023265 RepID=A0A930UBK6_9FLAO|nr:response regulator [Flavobacterium soyangense]MBF2709132.1 response regulator [Flavobacterium soyangense]
MKKNIKTFIVEDDRIAASIIKKILKSNKSINQFEFFTNGLLALEKPKTLDGINEKLPDFIVLDFNMPLMNGLEFLQNIKYIKVINQIPIFMNSASNKLDEYKNCLNYENVKGYFSKPFSKQTLNSILEYVESN